MGKAAINSHRVQADARLSALLLPRGGSRGARRRHEMTVDNECRPRGFPSDLSKGASSEAACSGWSGPQVLAAFPETIKNLAVAGRKGHLEVCSGFRLRLVEDGVDKPGSSADGQVAGFDMEIGLEKVVLRIGVDGGSGQDAAVVGDCDVLRGARHVDSRAVGSTAGMDSG